MPNKLFSYGVLFVLAGGAGVAFAQKAPENAPVRVVSQQALTEIPLADRTPVDFPNRPSLGALELAPLPGINDSLTTGPTPMGRPSPQDSPSEQLLGRITPEVFKEMAELERGNTFLKLQMQREELRNNLEKLKATYRQNRLDEISKREDVVRTRIQWWQEQEATRLEIEAKRAEEEALNQKIIEAERQREKLRGEALNRPAETDKKEAAPVIVLSAASEGSFSELYVLTGVRGTQGVLTARLKRLSDNAMLSVQKDDILPSGHVIKDITRDEVIAVYGDRLDKLSLTGQ